MSNLEYMRQVRVQSVGLGGIVDENGRHLVPIGNLQIKEGDTVWTDGRVVYGHVPIRPTVNLPSDSPGVPYSCEGQHSGALSDKNGLPINRMSESEPLKSHAHNWMYADGNGIYTNLDWAGKIDDQDSGFYYDMLVTKDAVWTAAPTLKQFPFLGKAPDGDREIAPAASLAARNFKYYESNSVAEWFPSHGHVLYHGGIQIRRSGAIVSELSLEPYQIALDRIKALYDQYDTKEGEVKARYYYGGTFLIKDVAEYVSNIGIYIGHISSEVVNFHFTNASGAWEMILATSLQGSCAPHTIDRERVKGVPDDAPEEQKWQKVHSWFCFLVPCIYYLIKVTSDGQQKILQFWISVKPFPNNYVPYYTDFEDKPGRPLWWDNARAMQVRPVNGRALNTFLLNYPDGIVETDFRTLRVYDKNGNLILNPEMNLLTFVFLFIPDPNFPVTAETRFGATNQLMYTVLATGKTGTVYVGDARLGPFQSGAGGELCGLCVNYTTGKAGFRYDGGWASVLGHLSIRHLDNGTTLVAINTQYLFVIDKNGKWTVYAPYCHNMSVETLRRLRHMKKPKDIAALIASRSKQ